MTAARRIRRGARRAALLAFAIGAVLLTGCTANAPLRPRAGDEQAAEIQRLKDRVLELQRRLSVTEVELERLRREVARLQGDPIAEVRSGPAPGRPGAVGRSPGEERSSGSSEAARPVRPIRSDPGFEVEDIDEPTTSRRGSSDAEGSSRRPTEGVPERPPRAVEEPIPSAEPVADAAEGSSGPEREPQTLSTEAQSLYDRGYTLYHQGRYVDAESTFRQFLQAHAGTELADNAQYWIGEARYARGDLDAALAAFRETARRFPDGNKVPDALLKAGETQAALGDAEGARGTYREVLRRFPGTTAAAVAEDRLAELR